MKIETNNSVVAYHLVDGASTFAYAVDARHACSLHPNEWSMTPWSAEKESAARARLEDEGRELPPPVELSPEDQAALDEYNKAVAEAAERLAAHNKKVNEERAEADQIARDEALVASPPPTPNPTPRRPFGRQGELTPAELEQIKKREAKKADDERIAREKAEADKQAANPNAKITS